MKRCETVYSKGKKRKTWKNLSNDKMNEKTLPNYYQQVLVPLKAECKYNYPNIKITHPFSFTFPSSFLSFDFCVFIFFTIVFRLTIWAIIFHVAFIRIFRKRHWELFYITTIWQDITKIVLFIYLFFHRMVVWFQYSLVNEKKYNFIKNEILHRYFSRVMVKRFLFFFNSCEWLLPIIYLRNAIKKSGRSIIK